MMKLFGLSQSPSPESSDHASWTTRGHFSTGLFVAEYFGRPVVSVSRKRNIRVNFGGDGIWGWGFGGL